MGVAKTFSQQGAECGTESNGCGSNVECGSCAAPKTCNGNKCTCTPTTCAALGYGCGTAPDGCGGTLDCGKCSGSNSCQPKGSSGKSCQNAYQGGCSGCPAGYDNVGSGPSIQCGGCPAAYFFMCAKTGVDRITYCGSSPPACPVGKHLGGEFSHCYAGTCTTCIAD